MEPLRHPVNAARDFAHDITHDYAPRTARRSRLSLATRFTRLRSRLFFIVQCSLSAGLAWYIGKDVLGHPAPYLAPVGAVVSLGLTFGQRYRRIVEVTVGVALGVLIGSIFATVFGNGVWQITVVAMLAMAVAALLGAGALMSTQAALQAIVVVTLIAHPGVGGLDRWLDAVVGTSIAFLAATIVPISPIGRPRDLARTILTKIGEILGESAKAYKDQDSALAIATLKRARASESDLDAFTDANNDGLAVVRHSPFRRRNAPAIQEIAALSGPLDRAVRNTRVLVRRIGTALWRKEVIDLPTILVLAELAVIVRQMGEILGNDEGAVTLRPQLIEIANSSNDLQIGTSLSSAVVIAQMRSIVVDLLELTGLSYEQARKQIVGYDTENPMMPDPHDASKD